MVLLQKEKVASKINVATTVGMSVCSSCAACGCGGSSCTSTCKGCHDKDVKLDSVSEVYSSN